MWISSELVPIRMAALHDVEASMIATNGHSQTSCKRNGWRSVNDIVEFHTKEGSRCPICSVVPGFES